jgi:hypothetical protein
MNGGAHAVPTMMLVAGKYSTENNCTPCRVFFIKKIVAT